MADYNKTLPAVPHNVEIADLVAEKTVHRRYNSLHSLAHAGQLPAVKELLSSTSGYVYALYDMDVINKNERDRLMLRLMDFHTIASNAWHKKQHKGANNAKPKKAKATDGVPSCTLQAPMLRSIRDHLVDRGTISHVEAEDLYRCRALPRRISDLRAYGYEIEREIRYDRNGQRYAHYRLVSTPEQQRQAA